MALHASQQGQKLRRWLQNFKHHSQRLPLSDDDQAVPSKKLSPVKPAPEVTVLSLKQLKELQANLIPESFRTGPAAPVKYEYAL